MKTHFSNLIFGLLLAVFLLSCKPEFPYEKRDLAGPWAEPVLLSPTYNGYMVVEKDSSGQRYLMRLLNPKTYRIGTVRTVKLFYDQYEVCATIGRKPNTTGIVYQRDDSLWFISDSVPHTTVVKVDGMTWTKKGSAWFSYDSEGNRYIRDTIK